MKRPTEIEIAYYMEEKGMAIGRTKQGVPIIKEEQDEAFLDYFESNGWKVWKNKMKSWKSCVASWLLKDTGKKEMTPSAQIYCAEKIQAEQRHKNMMDWIWININ